jgi:VRR-NUC domain
MSTCTHPDRRCLNQHELVRKYACPDCFEVMMCACDQEVGERCLSHQLGYATESTTQDRIKVTGGFQQGICSECRGLPADVAPAAAIHGRTSKIKRYYWREIMFRQLVLLQNWHDAGGPEHGPEFDTAFERSGREALEDIKQLHAATPKYEYNEPSAAQIIEKHGVEVVQIPAVHKQRPGERVAIEDGAELLTPEDYVLRHYQHQGCDGLKVESAPFHVLFGTLLYPVLSDPRDPKQRQVSFAREATPEFADGLVTMLQPHDFGTSGYARRRELEIDRHLASEELGPDEIESTFEFLLSLSGRLRSYLWATDAADIRTARQLMKVMPHDALLRVLRYLVGDYWQRYVGWPDLLLYSDADFFFAEVKSSNDRLSRDQMAWIEGNSSELRLPFRIAKITRPPSQ